MQLVRVVPSLEDVVVQGKSLPPFHTPLLPPRIFALGHLPPQPVQVLAPQMNSAGNVDSFRIDSNGAIVRRFVLRKLMKGRGGSSVRVGV